MSDGEVLDLVYEWLEQKTEYELLTNPILNDLIKIIYEEERERRAGITEWTEDRHNSDEEELRRESEELRDYSNFFDLEDR